MRVLVLPKKKSKKNTVLEYKSKKTHRLNKVRINLLIKYNQLLAQSFLQKELQIKINQMQLNQQKQFHN